MKNEVNRALVAKKKLFLLSALCVLTLTLIGCKDKNDEQENGGGASFVDCLLPADAEAVDLGLPSGTKWANMNVGATKPEEYGAYFAWGETTPKREYSWDKYYFCYNSSWRKITKYTRPDGQANCIWYNGRTFIGDNKTTLEPENDAAYVNWGGGWHMPTNAEIEELIGNCTWEWKTEYNGTSVNGYLVTSKKAGYTDRSIFLPAAGHYEGISLIKVKTIGNYWSASLDGYSHGAYRLYFGGDAGIDCSGIERYRGFSVRPVCD